MASIARSDRLIGARLAVVIGAFLAAPAAAQCPAQWIAVGAPGLSGSSGTVAWTMVALPGGDVIVAGRFSHAAGLLVNNIARLNPTTGVWSALGSGPTKGVNDTVGALALMPGGDVIVGGQFTSAGGVAASNIARYNPTSGAWSPLGAGTVGDVLALAVLPGGDVVAGGTFTSAGGVGASRIARWAPAVSTWFTYGPGANTEVSALAVLPGGDLIAAGNFTTIGGITASRIARLNVVAGTWSPLGSGADAKVHALAILPGGDVIAGGGFTTAGGVSASRIARCNPTTSAWSALGTGADGGVFRLAVLPGGDVIAGGAFGSTGGVSVGNIARCNPATVAWAAMGSGADDAVFSLATLSDGNVLVGGLFTAAGGATANHIARYDFAQPAPSVMSSPQSQNLCANSAVVLSIIPGPTTSPVYQWQWRQGPSLWLSMVEGANAAPGGPPLFDGTGVSGTNALLDPPGSDRTYPVNEWNVPLQVRCIITSPCGGASSDVAVLTICPIDLDDDGVFPGRQCDTVADLNDLLYFLQAFEDGDPLNGSDLDDDGDITVSTPDGQTDLNDLLFFLARFEAGC